MHNSVRTRTVRYGPRSFRDVAFHIWNILPTDLKSSNISIEQFMPGYARITTFIDLRA